MYLNKWSDSLHSGRVIARPFLQSFFVISTIVISRVDRISQRLYTAKSLKRTPLFSLICVQGSINKIKNLNITRRPRRPARKLAICRLLIKL